MQSVTIEIPMMPPFQCSPNYHGSRWRRAEATREWRETAGWAALVLVDHPVDAAQWPAAIMDIHVAWCCGRREMDDDNLITAIKPARDGIADVLYPGMGDWVITTGRVTQSRGDGVTVVTLREGDGG